MENISNQDIAKPKVVNKDENGNVIYQKYSDGLEIWFDVTGYINHAKYPDGREKWFNKDGTYYRQKDKNGFEWYNKKGNPWKIKFPNGFKLYGVFIIKLYELLFLKED